MRAESFLWALALPAGSGVARGFASGVVLFLFFLVSGVFGGEPGGGSGACGVPATAWLTERPW